MHEIFFFSTSQASGFLKTPSKQCHQPFSLSASVSLPARQPLDPWVPQTPVWSWSHLHFGENEADVRAHGLSRSRPRCTAPNVSQDAPHCGLLCWNIRRHRKARPRRRGKSARPSSGSWSRCWEVSRAQGRPAQPGSVIYLRFRVNDGAARLGRGAGGRVFAASHGCGVGSKTGVGVRPPPASCVALSKAPGRPLSSLWKKPAAWGVFVTAAASCPP